MILDEALEKRTGNELLARKFWIDNKSHMRLCTDAKKIDELLQSINLTQESIEADDWVIIDDAN